MSLFHLAPLSVNVPQRDMHILDWLCTLGFGGIMPGYFLKLKNIQALYVIDINRKPVSIRSRILLIQKFLRQKIQLTGYRKIESRRLVLLLNRILSERCNDANERGVNRSHENFGLKYCNNKRPNCRRPKNTIKK
jgi:hypothetical protein